MAYQTTDWDAEMQRAGFLNAPAMLQSGNWPHYNFGIWNMQLYSFYARIYSSWTLDVFLHVVDVRGSTLPVFQMEIIGRNAILYRIFGRRGNGTLALLSQGAVNQNNYPHYPISLLSDEELTVTELLLFREIVVHVT